MKRIMILYSAYTGNGHKSIADALIEQLGQYEDVEVCLIDGFSLIGKAGIEISKIYGPVTRGAKKLWDLTYQIANHSTEALNNLISSMIHSRFMAELHRFRPNLILSVHALFNGSVIDLLEYYQLDIPFVTLQADIISIHKAWCDPRATLTLCPTPEAYERSIKNGMPKDKLSVCGFPTRKRFCDAARAREHRDYDGNRPMDILMMSGGEGSGGMIQYAEAALSHTDCRVVVVCGRNMRMKNDILDTLSKKYEGRIKAYGFVGELQELFEACDLLITRGSPNAVMEGVIMNVPILVTDALPGQEAENPELIVQRNLGLMVRNPIVLPAIIAELKSNGGEKLRKIREAQKAYRNFDHAKNIAATLYNLAAEKERFIPKPKRYYPVPSYTQQTVKRMKSKI